MDRHTAVDLPAGPVLFILHRDAGLLLEGRQIDVDGALEAGIVQHHRVQGLRERSDLFERGLRHLLDLPQIGLIGARFGRSAALRASQHGSDGGENLAELIVQLAREGAEGILLGGDQLLRQLAAEMGEIFHPIEHAPIVVEQVDAVQHHHNQHRREEDVHVPLGAPVDRSGVFGGAFLALVVLHQ